MPLDPPEDPLQHLAHLAGLEMPKPLEGQLPIPLVPGAVEHDHVEVWIEAK
jgi:hypothetical protein